MQNVTRNHHFVAQVEQRLNAIDSSILKKNQKIYSFKVIDRESYEIFLEPSEGISIINNLSFNDLFSFDVLDERQRLNFEGLFGEYETRVGQLTESLLSKIESKSTDIKDELLRIFCAETPQYI